MKNENFERLKSSLHGFHGYDHNSGFRFVLNQVAEALELVIVDKQGDSLRSHATLLNYPDIDRAEMLCTNPSLDYVEKFEIKSFLFQGEHLSQLHLHSDRGQEYLLDSGA